MGPGRARSEDEMPDQESGKQPQKPLFSLPDTPGAFGSLAEDVVEPRSFRNQLISALGYTAIIPIVLLAVLQQQFQKATEAADRSQQVMAQNLAATVTDYVHSTASLLRLAALPSAGGGRSFAAVMAQQPDVAALRVAGEKGRLVYEESRSPGLAGTRLWIGKCPAGQPFCAEFRTVAGSGYLVVRSESPRPDEPAVEALVRQKDIIGFLARASEEGHFQAGIMDRGGRALAVSEGTEPASLGEGLPPGVLNSGDRVLQTPGTRRQAKVIALSAMPVLGWNAVVSQPLIRRDEQMSRSLETSGVLLLLAVFATFAVGSGMAWPLTRSVNRLTDAVEEFGRTGRMPEPAADKDKEGTTELVELGEAFRRMSQSVNSARRDLQELNAKLETEVADRTATLLSRNSELRALWALMLPINGSSSILRQRVESCVEAFRKLAGLERLEFVPLRKDSGEHVPRERCIPVAQGEVPAGYLRVGEGDVLTEERTESLRRLADALAIVLANEALVNELSREHATLAAVFRSMTDGVVIIGRSGRVIYSNALADQLLVPEGKVESRMLPDIAAGWEFVPPFGPGDLRQEGRIVRVRSRERDFPKTLDILPFSVSELPGYEGRRTGWLVRDVTRESQIEAMKDNLVSVVAHELKTPVTALSLQAQSVRSRVQKGEPVGKADIDEMLEDTMRLGRLIDDLLDQSRIEAGTMKLSPRVVQVASLIDRAARLTRSRYAIRVTRDIDPDAEVFRVDPERITQVFVNLFNNAARYKRADQDEALCSVTVRPDGNYVKILVRDEGVGIAPEKIGHIFEPFFQNDLSDTRSGGGAGLGLSIVRGIVAAHGGTVQADSSPEGGSTFCVRLPY